MTGSHRVVAWGLAVLATAGLIATALFLDSPPRQPMPVVAHAPDTEETDRRALAAALIAQIAADSREQRPRRWPVAAPGTASSRRFFPAAIPPSPPDDNPVAVKVPGSE